MHFFVYSVYLPDMESLLGLLPWIQIVLAIVLTIMILIQQRGAGAGSAFGGGDEGGVHFERRGFEKTLFKTTVITAILFVGSILAYAALKDPYGETYIEPTTDTATTTIDGITIEDVTGSDTGIDFEVLDVNTVTVSEDDATTEEPAQ